MIKQDSGVQLWRYSVSRDTTTKQLVFTPEDITAQLATPIVDSGALDETLDQTTLTLYSAEALPIQPLTRLKMALKDTAGGTETLYRYVDSDQVEIAWTEPEMGYKHTLTVLEPTKILERVNVDTLCFTNVLEERAQHGVPQAPVIVDEWTNEGQIRSVNWTSATDFAILGKYVQKGASQMVKNPFSSINFVESTGDQNDKMTLKWELSKPDGTKEELSAPQQIQYTSVGNYSFKYYAYYAGISQGGVTTGAGVVWSATWTVRCVESIDELNGIFTYTMAGVIDRLLLCAETLRYYSVSQNLTTVAPRFHLDETLRTRLSALKAPEFCFTGATLWECLMQIGAEMHAIPRLVPSATDETKWNTITFDFTGTGTEYTNTDYSLYDAGQSAADYATTFVSRVANATQADRDGKFSTVVPFTGGWLSCRSEDGTDAVIADNRVLALVGGLPIQYITKVECKMGDIVRDITASIYEAADYALKSDYSEHIASGDGKDHCLYFTRGGKSIQGFSFAPQSILQIPKTAWANIVSTYFYGAPAADLAKAPLFRITYVPLASFTATACKPTMTAAAEPVDLWYNQSANAVDVTAYGKNVRSALIRSGNPQIVKTHYYDKLADVPHPGQWQNVGGAVYYASQVNREIIPGATIKATVTWSRDYLALSSVALNRAVRQYEVSEVESTERNIRYGFYIRVNSESGASTGRYESEWAAMKYDIANALAGSTAGGNKHVSAAELVCKGKNASDVSRHLLMPATAFAMGNSAVFAFAMEDNYGAGKSVRTAGKDVNLIEDAKYQYSVPYGDEFGRVETIGITLWERIPVGSMAEAVGDALPRYPDNFTPSEGLADTNARKMWGTGGYPFLIQKDSREKLSFTLQWHCVSNEADVIVYPGFAEALPWVAAENGTFRYVFANRRISPHESRLEATDYSYVYQLAADTQIGHVKVEVTEATAETPSYVRITGAAAPAGEVRPQAVAVIDAEGRLLLAKNGEVGQGLSGSDFWISFSEFPI